MATLKDEFQFRYSEARVVALTNPDRVASQVDQERLDAAVDDALVEFVDWVGTTYNGDNPRHVKSAVALVEVILIERGTGGIAAAQALRERTEASLTRLSASSTTSRQGIQVSGQDEWASPRNPHVMVPWSDRSRWRGFLPRGERWMG